MDCLSEMFYTFYLINYTCWCFLHLEEKRFITEDVERLSFQFLAGMTCELLIVKNKYKVEEIQGMIDL